MYYSLLLIFAACWLYFFTHMKKMIVFSFRDPTIITWVIFSAHIDVCRMYHSLVPVSQSPPPPLKRRQRDLAMESRDHGLRTEWHVTSTKRIICVNCLVFIMSMLFWMLLKSRQGVLATDLVFFSCVSIDHSHWNLTCEKDSVTKMFLFANSRYLTVNNNCTHKSAMYIVNVLSKLQLQLLDNLWKDTQCGGYFQI